MTRLINADAVYKILESCEIKKDTYGSLLNDWDHGYNCGIERAESEIECAPTVDAIPIEWVDAIPIEWIEEWCISQDLTYIKIAVEKLLDNWRKEHDKTN